MMRHALLILLLVFLLPASPAPGQEAASAPPQQSGTAAPEPDGQQVSEGKHFLPNILLHEPLYFIFGVSEEYDTNSKFQLSFKYRLVPRFTKHLYFSYTQLSVWDLGMESSPFHDTSYRPSLFYYYNDDEKAIRNGLLFRMMGGVEHESNGKGGIDSRSINILFVRPSFILGTANRRYQFTIAPKVWAYLDKSDNKDIDDFRGAVELLLAAEQVAGKGKGLQVAAVLRKGTEKNYGSYQVDISFPDHFLEFGYWYLQYFSGWGETILDYNVRVKPQVRVGIMAVRW